MWKRNTIPSTQRPLPEFTKKNEMVRRSSFPRGASISWGDTPLARMMSTASVDHEDRPVTSLETSTPCPAPAPSGLTSHSRRMSERVQLSSRKTTGTPDVHSGRSGYKSQMSVVSFVSNNESLPSYIRRTTSLVDDVFDDARDVHTMNPVHDRDDYANSDPCSRTVQQLKHVFREFVIKRKSFLRRLLLAVLLVLYLAYFGYAMYYHFGDEGSVRLLVCTVLFGAAILLHMVPLYMWAGCLAFLRMAKEKTLFWRITRRCLYVTTVTLLVITLIVLGVKDSPYNLQSLPGLLLLSFMTYITSSNPAKVDWHPVFWGMVTQYSLAVIVLRLRWGSTAICYLAERAIEVLQCATEGSGFVFGRHYTDHKFAFAVLPVVIFCSTSVAILRHVGLLQTFIRVIGRCLAGLFRVTPAESVCLGGNVFVGLLESPLLIRSYLPEMTKSELHTVMTGGFATVAGSVLLTYIAFGVPASHVLGASVISVPAALAMSKLSCPETETPLSSSDDYIRLEGRRQSNIIEAVCDGAVTSIKLVVHVVVLVIAFLGVFTFLNITLSWLGQRVGIIGLTLQYTCSYLLYPCGLMLGVDPVDCRAVAYLVGVKVFTNELTAFTVLSRYKDNRWAFQNYTSRYNDTDWEYRNDDIVLTQWNRTLAGGYISHRSEVITTYAICGFSSIASLAMMLGMLVALVPNRRRTLSHLVVRAFIVGNVTSFTTACMAGLLYKDPIQ